MACQGKKKADRDPHKSIHSGVFVGIKTSRHRYEFSISIKALKHGLSSRKKRKTIIQGDLLL